MFARSLFALALALAVGIESAHAHGGQFQGPGGRVPPGMREPFDPVPPPPTPPSGQPPITPGTGTPAPSGIPTGPNTGPAQPVTPVMPGTGSRPSRPRTPMTYADWSFWYAKNRDPIENLKDAIYFDEGTGSGIYWLGGTHDGNRTDSTHEIRQRVEKDIVPALLWAMDPDNAGHPDVESAAYIGLGKIARELSIVARIEAALDPRSGRDVVTREAAALALGLLRRSEEELQFPAADLDRIRQFLFDVFEDRARATRERGFAALSIGLLGDQPTGSKTASGQTASAVATTERLFATLDEEHASADIPVGALVAIGLQPADSLSDEQRDVLRRAVIKGRLFSRGASDLVRAWCAHAMGCVGTQSDIAVLQRMLARKKDSMVKRSAAISLGRLAARVSGPARVELVEGLLRAMDKERDASTRAFGWISIAQALVHEVEAQRTDVIESTNALDRLVKVAEKGSWIDRPYGAIAVALVGRAITEEADLAIYGAWRQGALETLRSGFSSRKLDARTRSAYAVALGMVRDRPSLDLLTKTVADRKSESELRGYAAVGIGLIGNAPRAGKTAIRAALKERRSDEMRVQCATALGLLHDRGAVDLLLEELSAAHSQAVKGQIVLALSQIGDERAVDPLVARLKDRRERDLTRALSCAGLAIVGDMEPTPSLALLRNGANYRAMSDLLLEAFSIL